MKHNWAHLHVETEEIVAFLFMFKVWSIHGSWRFSWIHEHLSFHFIIIHLTKHIGRELKHCQALKQDESTSVLQQVRIRVPYFCKLLWWSCRSLNGENVGENLDWFGAISTKLHAIKVLMSICDSFDPSMFWCFCMNDLWILHVHDLVIRMLWLIVISGHIFHFWKFPDEDLHDFHRVHTFPVFLRI